MVSSLGFVLGSSIYVHVYGVASVVTRFHTHSIQPPDEAFMPRTKLTKMMDVMFGVKNPVVKAAITPRLMEHRDFILRTYCEVPVVLGGGN